MALTPLLGKPLLERAFEYWIERGATSFDVFLTQAPHRTESTLGDGQRWGVSVAYHTGSPEFLSGSSEEMTILGLLDAFPAPDDLASLECATVSHNQDWTGWIQAKFGVVQEFALSRTLPRQLPRVFHPRRKLGTREAFLALQLYALKRNCVEAREISPGVWLGPGALVHPTATLQAPLYLGANSTVDAGAMVGPAVVVGRDSQVGANSELVDCWVRENVGVAPRTKAKGEVVGRKRRPSESPIGRLLALVLAVLTSPLLVLSWRKRRVALDLVNEEEVFVSPLPATLIEVVKGKLALLGRKPRASSDLLGLPHAWNETFFATPPGVWGCHGSLDEEFFFCALPKGRNRWFYFLQSLLRA